MDFFTEDRSIYLPLQGRVATPAGAPLGAARVAIEHEFLGQLGEVTADASGRWRRDGLSVPGRYRFNVRTPAGRAGLSQWLEVRGDRPLEVRVDPGNGVTVPVADGGTIPDLRVSLGDGLLVGEGIPTGRLFGIDAPALLSDRGIEIGPLVERLVAAGVGLVRTQATVPRPGSRAPCSNWHVSPHVDEQLVEWREIRDARLAALMRAGIRVHLDLFDDPSIVHSAAHLALRSPELRAKLNAWAGQTPSEATVRTLADRYLSRLPKEVRRGLVVGAARDHRKAAFEPQWLGKVAGAASAAGIRNPVPIPVPPGQTSDLPAGRELLTVGVAPEWIDGTRIPAGAHRAVTDYLAAVQRGSPGSHLVLNTAGVGPGFIEAAPELARAVWDLGCSLVLATPETPDAWSAVSWRVVTAVARRLELAS